MSLKFMQSNTFSGKAHYISNFQGNDGPKRGIGPGPTDVTQLLPKSCRGNGIGPKRGTGKFTVDTTVTREPLKPSKTISYNPPTLNHSQNLQPHAGPVRGIGFGPGVVDSLPGPKRGHGTGPGIDPLSLFEVGGDEQEKECIRLTNEFRQSQGKPPLKLIKSLSQIGMPHTKNMLAGKVPIGHTGFEDRARQIGGYAAAENVAYCQGYSDPIRTFVEGWIHSPGHRRNLLGDFTHMGIAVAHDGNTWYGTQLFARY